jgi:superfamily I DNA and/or RNA helicase
MLAVTCYRKQDCRHATGDEKKKLREQINHMDKIWNQRYFDQVDIVFTSNSMSAHALLALHFKPRILASDEVSQAALADQAIPAAAFIESLELVWATGDPKQQGPLPLVEGSNETIGDLSKSPFDVLFGNKSIAERIILLEQNRMRPAISGMVSRLWYDGKLRDGDPVLSVSPLETTILEAYETLKPHWNGSTRMMVDVSGLEVFSECFGDWTSLYNRA